MRGDVSIRCACGKVRGHVTDLHPGAANRVVCHCRGCRAYAAYMGLEDQILDAHGGSDIFQISPAALAFDDGVSQVQCLRMTPKGAFRWYTACCGTPIAGSFYTRSVPFLSLYPLCIDPDSLDGPLDEYRGPVRVRVNGAFEKGQVKALKAGVGALLPMLLRYSWMCMKWMVRGEHKRSPFFDRETGDPIAEPQVIGIADDFV